MFGQKILHTVRAERNAACIRKSNRVIGSSSFLKPGFQDRHRLFGQRGATLLSPLAVATDMRSTGEDDIASAKTNQLRKTEACLDRQQKQGPIPSSEPGGSIRSSQERLNLWRGQEIDQSAVKSFGRHGKDTLDQGRTAGLQECYIVEEGMDRCQSKIAASDAAMPLALQMIKEGTNEGCIEVIQCEFGWSLLDVLLSNPTTNGCSPPPAAMPGGCWCSPTHRAIR